MRKGARETSRLPRGSLLALLCLAALLGLGSRARAQSCLACHSLGFEANLARLAEAAAPPLGEVSPCPGVRKAARELELTENLLRKLALLLPRHQGRGMAAARLWGELRRLDERLENLLAAPLSEIEEINGSLRPIRREAERNILAPLRDWNRAERGRLWLGWFLACGVLILALMLLARLRLGRMAGDKRRGTPGAKP